MEFHQTSEAPVHLFKPGTTWKSIELMMPLEVIVWLEESNG
jgi:hypothetical protein